MKGNFKPLGFILLILGVFYFISKINSTSKGGSVFESKPYLTLTDNPMNLVISEFDWGYGVVEINKLHGDFEDLDKKVYNLLVGKQGICNVYLANNQRDKYGKGSDSTLYIGKIDISELNKYEDWSFWHKEEGIRPLLQWTINFNSPVDSTGTAPTESYTLDNQATSVPIETVKPVEPISFVLNHENLYPDEDDRAIQIQQGVTGLLFGTIKVADFSNGVMEVAQDNGDYSYIRVEPENLPSSMKGDLRYFMKPGTRIQFVCTLAGARELELISARFTSH